MVNVKTALHRFLKYFLDFLQMILALDKNPKDADSQRLPKRFAIHNECTALCKRCTSQAKDYFSNRRILACGENGYEIDGLSRLIVHGRLNLSAGEDRNKG